MFKFNAISYMFVFRILISVCFGEKSFSRKKGGGGFVFMAFPVLGVCFFGGIEKNLLFLGCL